ncbi:MAG: hypothetical protein HY543_08540 [Deltaproteobacteria bacterium]|nr:hypothetical protein [Deltaproteobacteria bacterium]
MVDYARLAARMAAAVRQDSPEGEYISEAEGAAIRAACPDAPAALVRRIGEFMNEHCSGVLLSDEDVYRLTEEFPHMLPLIKALHVEPLASSRLRFFVGKENEADVWLLRYARNELGFADLTECGLHATLAEVWFEDAKGIRDARLLSDEFRDFVRAMRERYGTDGQPLYFDDVARIYRDQDQRRIVLHPDFPAFAKRLQVAFRIDVLKSLDAVAAIFRDPRERALAFSPAAAEAWRILDQHFHFGTIAAESKGFDLLFLEGLAKRPDREAYCKKLFDCADRLRTAYGEHAKVGDLEAVKQAVVLAERTKDVARLLAPRVVRLFRALGQGSYHHLFRTEMLGRSTWGAWLNLVKSPRVLVRLEALQKQFGERLHECFVDSPFGWSALASLALNPAAERYLALPIEFDGLSTWFSPFAQVRQRPNAGHAAVLKAFHERYPTVDIGSAVYGAPWLGHHEWRNIPDLVQTIRDLPPAEQAYAALVTLHGEDPIPFERFILLAGRQNLIEKLNLEAFRADAKTLAALLPGNVSPTPNFVFQCLWAQGAMRTLLSPEGRVLLGHLRAWNVQIGEAAGDLEKASRLVSALRRFEWLRTAGITAGITDEDIDLRSLKEVDATIERLSENERRNVELFFHSIRKERLFERLRWHDVAHLIALATSNGNAIEGLRALKIVLGRPLGLESGSRMFLERESEMAARYLAKPDFLTVLADPEFTTFCHDVARTCFASTALRVTDVRELQKLYRRCARFYSAAFGALRDVVQKDLGVHSWTVKQLRGVMQLAARIDVAGVRIVKTELGVPVMPNDLFLLDAIAKDPALRALAKDRAALLAEAAGVSAKKNPPLERKKKDFAGVPYTERPPLTELGTPALLRLALLRRALQRPTFLQELGAIVQGDLRDRRSEHGGIMEWQQGRLHLRSVASVSHNNGAYLNRLDRFLHGGLASFHLHASQPNSAHYAGPSGHPYQADGGDWGVVRAYGVTDVVITTLGYTPGTSDRMRVNVDLYYVDSAGVPFVVDMGQYVVPLPAQR